VTVLHVAHRAGNELALLETALALGADLLEADVHLRRGRLEVRHGKSLGPVPWLWEPWHLLRDDRLELAALRDGLPAGAVLLLDLKGWQPWLGRRVRDAMQGAGPYAVCSRHWRMLAAFADLQQVRVVHSARTARELRRLDRHLGRHRTWGVSVHRDLLTADGVAALHRRAEVVMTWPVDSVAVYDRVVALGVDAVTSNDLGVLLDR
jgi:glycerophosphoryl diester phosphodiesterase